MIMAVYENDAEDLKLNDGTKHHLVSSIVKRYQSLMKSRSKNSDIAKADRDAFLVDMATCLNFGVNNLRSKLLSDRVRSNLGVILWRMLTSMMTNLGPGRDGQ